MGNVRLSYFKNGSNSAEVLEENNYYPFGMKHEGYNALAGNPAYGYGYNNKELQKETGWSDYGARMYMPEIGRWSVIDPLAEVLRRHTPYNYGVNNPVMFIDPDGRLSQSFIDGMMSSGSGVHTITGNGFSNGLGYDGRFTNNKASFAGSSADPGPSTWQSVKNFFRNIFSGNKKGADISTFAPGAIVTRIPPVQVGPLISEGVATEAIASIEATVAAITSTGALTLGAILMPTMGHCPTTDWTKTAYGDVPITTTGDNAQQRITLYRGVSGNVSKLVMSIFKNINH